MLTEIAHYLPISDRLATAGQPTAAQFADIARAGFTVVVNLALPTSDRALTDEWAVVASYGMTYYPIPVVWEQPTQRDFQQFQAVLARHDGDQILVHCAKNMRVAVFVYLHQRLKGVPKAEAQVQLAKIWQPNETWQRFIDAICPNDAS